MRRPFVFAVTFATLALGSMTIAEGGGCGPMDRTTEGKGSAVTVVGCGFQPTILHAPVGAKVIWSNGDYFPHAVNGLGWNATAPGQVTNPGSAVSFTFSRPGIYPYMCYVHPGMSGIVVVGDVALNPNADGGPRADSAVGARAPVPTSEAASAPGARAATTPSVEMPLAIGLAALAALVGYAFSFLPRYRWSDGAFAIRRRHGVHAR